MAVKFTNNAVTTLTAGISAGVTQFAVASNSGFPSLGGADHTYVTINSEVVKVTAISGTTFTCIATSSAHANGSNVELRVTAELLDDFATDLEAMPKTGGVFTGNVSFVDTKKLILGTGLDLEVYHDGTDSYVNTSSGHLRLSTSDTGQSVQILGSGEALAEFSDDGDVDLFHNGTLKFSTTATGVNVVGNITATGTVDGVDIQTLNNAVTANTAKTGITSAQATAISNNTAKTGITSAQTSAITANTAKTGITSAQATAISNNTAKTGITSSQASAITANTAKTGITSSQAASITASLPKTGGTMTGNIAMSGTTLVDGRNISVDGARLANTSGTNTGDQTIALTGEVTGSGTGSFGATIASNAVTTVKIASDAVTTAKLNLISTSGTPSIEAKSDGTTDGYIQLNCSANSHGIKLKSPPHSAGASYTLVFPNDDGNNAQALTTNGSGVLTWTTPTDATKLPLAGGTMTGNLRFGDNDQIKLGAGDDLEIYHENTNNHSYIWEKGSGDLYLRGTDVRVKSNADNDDMATFVENGAVSLYYSNAKKFETTSSGANVTGNIAVTGTVDGVDIQTLNSTALLKTGGTMTNNLIMSGTSDMYLQDNGKVNLGAGNDLQIYHDGSHSWVRDVGIGRLLIDSDGASVDIVSGGNSQVMGRFNKDGSVLLYHDGDLKFSTTVSGVLVGGSSRGTLTTDNDGSFNMNESNNFKCTPSGNFALTFTNIASQSGNILFINSGGHTVSAHANTKVTGDFLSTVSTAGTYLLSYFSDGTNVYMTNSAIYT